MATGLRLPIAAAVFMAFAALASGANATTMSFSGDFHFDNDRQLIAFGVTTASVVTMRSYGYAGGTQADGTVVPEGGFDTIFSLFDGAGNLIGLNDDGNDATAGACPVPASGVTGFAFDSCLTLTLPVVAGGYSLFLTQAGNFPVSTSLADGFTRDGQGNYTPSLLGPFPPCPNGQFCDDFGVQRTGHWAVDVQIVDASLVNMDEPVEFALFGLGLVGLGLASRRRRMR